MPCLRRATPLLGCASLCALFGCGGKAFEPPTVTTDGSPSPQLQTVMKYIEGQMQACSIPGAAIAVVQNGKLVDSAGLGVRDPSTAQPVTPGTLFFDGGREHADRRADGAPARP
jgi:CubicO group peptidase (beta-lactamase class C family)